MSQHQRKIIFWTPEIINLIDGKPIGGIAVQMYFWAQVFAENGWQVYAFTENTSNTIEKENIVFKPKKSIKHVSFLLDWWYAFCFILTLKPDFVVYRGANKALYPLSFFARLFGKKVIMFGASDVNFEPGKEVTATGFGRKLYQRAIKHIDYFVVQNCHQKETLKLNYGQNSLMLYNIWGKVNNGITEKIPSSDVVWVANFRRLKRVEWVLDAAEKLQANCFVLAGAKANDERYFEEIKEKAESMGNVEFLGGRSFFYVNELVSRSRVLLCTSTFEGFPNTFLQAWSNGFPVISTVDPSGIIRDNNLGVVVENEEEFFQALQKVLNNKEYYDELSKSVTAFFADNHSAESGYKKIMSYIS